MRNIERLTGTTIVYRGDISNEVVPRLVLVFEGLVGVLRDVKDKAAYDRAIKRGKWNLAVQAFDINEVVAKHIWHIAYHLNYNMDVVTFLGEEFAEELNKRLTDDEGFPIGRVWATTPNRLARELAYRPDIAMIYDADSSRVFTYGSKGSIVNPYQPKFI